MSKFIHLHCGVDAIETAAKGWVAACPCRLRYRGKDKHPVARALQGASGIETACSAGVFGMRPSHESRLYFSTLLPRCVHPRRRQWARHPVQRSRAPAPVGACGVMEECLLGVHTPPPGAIDDCLVTEWPNALVDSQDVMMPQEPGLAPLVSPLLFPSAAAQETKRWRRPVDALAAGVHRQSLIVCWPGVCNAMVGCCPLSGLQSHRGWSPGPFNHWPPGIPGEAVSTPLFPSLPAALPCVHTPLQLSLAPSCPGSWPHSAGKGPWLLARSSGHVSVHDLDHVTARQDRPGPSSDPPPSASSSGHRRFPPPSPTLSASLAAETADAGWSPHIPTRLHCLDVLGTCHEMVLTPSGLRPSGRALSAAEDWSGADSLIGSAALLLRPTSHPRSLAVCLGDRLVRVDQRSGGASGRQLLFASPSPARGPLTSMCSWAEALEPGELGFASDKVWGEEHLVAVAAASGDVLLFDLRRPGCPALEWSTRREQLPLDSMRPLRAWPRSWSRLPPWADSGDERPRWEPEGSYDHLTAPALWAACSVVGEGIMLGSGAPRHSACLWPGRPASTSPTPARVAALPGAVGLSSGRPLPRAALCFAPVWQRLLEPRVPACALFDGAALEARALALALPARGWEEERLFDARGALALWNPYAGSRYARLLFSKREHTAQSNARALASGHARLAGAALVLPPPSEATRGAARPLLCRLGGRWGLAVSYLQSPAAQEEDEGDARAEAARGNHERDEIADPTSASDAAPTPMPLHSRLFARMLCAPHDGSAERLAALEASTLEDVDAALRGVNAPVTFWELVSCLDAMHRRRARGLTEQPCAPSPGLSWTWRARPTRDPRVWALECGTAREELLAAEQTLRRALRQQSTPEAELREFAPLPPVMPPLQRGVERPLPSTAFFDMPVGLVLQPRRAEAACAAAARRLGAWMYGAALDEGLERMQPPLDRSEGLFAVEDAVETDLSISRWTKAELAPKHMKMSHREYGRGPNIRRRRRSKNPSIERKASRMVWEWDTRPTPPPAGEAQAPRFAPHEEQRLLDRLEKLLNRPGSRWRVQRCGMLAGCTRLDVGGEEAGPAKLIPLATQGLVPWEALDVEARWHAVLVVPLEYEASDWEPPETTPCRDALSEDAREFVARLEQEWSVEGEAAGA